MWRNRYSTEYQPTEYDLKSNAGKCSFCGTPPGTRFFDFELLGKFELRGTYVEIRACEKCEKKLHQTSGLFHASCQALVNVFREAVESPFKRW